MYSCFLQHLIKKKLPTNKKMDETNNISGNGSATKLSLLSLQKTGRASEDPNLPIDDP